MKVIVNPRLKHPRLVVEDSGESYLEVGPQDIDNIELHSKVLAKNKDWLAKTIKEKEKNRPHPISKDYEFVDGMAIYVMGRVYKLKIKGKEIKIEGKYLLAPKSKFYSKFKSFLIKTYGEYITQKVRTYQLLLGLKSVTFEYKNFTKKFGLCVNHNLSFNWKILMLEPSLIDYIILHELAHLKEMNHDPKFWEEVYKIMPDFKARDQRLRILREIVLNF